MAEGRGRRMKVRRDVAGVPWLEVGHQMYARRWPEDMDKCCSGEGRCGQTVADGRSSPNRPIQVFVNSVQKSDWTSSSWFILGPLVGNNDGSVRNPSPPFFLTEIKISLTKDLFIILL